MAGLVSVPTSATRADEAVALRRSVSGFAPDPRRSRVARLRRAVGFAARGHLAERRGHRPDQVLMITATYADGVDWEPRHVSAWLGAMREWLRRRDLPCRYVWVAELTKRGRLHYHLALWLPASVYLPSADASGWWAHGMTRTERARAAVPYLLKYLSKGLDLGDLPKGARMYGVGGLEHSIRRARRWLRMPAFVRQRADIYDDWTSAKGGGWCSPDGFVVPSEFQRAWLGDRWGLVRVAEYPQRFKADGPFCWIQRGSRFAAKGSAA